MACSGPPKRPSHGHTGHTPSTKKKKSGKASKILQLIIQEELRTVVTTHQGCEVSILALMQRLSKSYTQGEVGHAVKTMFDVTRKAGVFHNLKLLDADADPDPSKSSSRELRFPSAPASTITELTTQQSICTQCDCVSNVINIVSEELKSIASTKDESLFRAHDLTELTAQNIETELRSRTPILLRLLNDSVTKKYTSPKLKLKTTAKKRNGVIHVVAKILHIYNRELNGVAKINGLCMLRSGMTKRSIKRFNETYDCVSYQTLTRLLDSFKEESIARVAKWTNEETSHCGDNVDKRVKSRHETSSKSSLDLHMYNNLLYRSRIQVGHLSDIPPTQPDQVTDTDLSQFLPNTIEQEALKERVRSEISKSWSLMKELKDLCKGEDIAHDYTPEMCTKTEKAHIGVLNKCETKTDEMIDILQHCSQFPSKEHTARSVYRGDYATYERSQSALAVMANDPGNMHFIPTFADFHLQMRWSKAIIERFLDKENVRDQFSLAALRVLLNCKQVNEDTSKNYYAVSHFLDKVLDSYLLTYAKEHLTGALTSDQILKAMDKLIEDIFVVHESPIPSGCCHLCTKSTREYKTAKGLQNHIKNNHPGASTISIDDRDANSSNTIIFNHSVELLKMLLIKRILDNAIKRGDGQTLSLLLKHMLLYFKQLGCTKYTIACFEFVAQQQIFLSEKMATLVRQDRFVNNRGGARNNIPVDLDVEHSNLFFKNNFRVGQGQLSDRVLDRLSYSQDIVFDVLDSFYTSFQLQHFDKQHTVNEEKYLADVMKVVEILEPLDIFNPDNQTQFKSARLVKSSSNILTEVDMFKLRFWMLERLKIMRDQQLYKYIDG